MRIKLTISYNGNSFMGSQSQKETDNTVIGTLQAIFKRLGIISPIIASGRTDRGVHASRQVVHCDLPPFWTDLDKLKHTLSYQLPSSIVIRRIEQVSKDFHARYSASKRVYRYILSDRTPNPFMANFVTFVPTLNFEKVAHAITLFEGEHNFEMFKKSGSDVTHYVRHISKAFAYQHEGYTVLTFEANGYLRSQIRLMVGFLLKISSGALNEAQLLEQLTCQKEYNRHLAPYQGLYLARIIY